MMKQVKTEIEFDEVLAEIEVFFKKGFANLTNAETLELESISNAVAAYEKQLYGDFDFNYPPKIPNT
jgi:antitoxin component HigA of HigAB toxin-antitoxin module